MITLYDYLPSQNAYKVRLLLSHLRQPYHAKSSAFLKAKGNGTAICVSIQLARCRQSNSRMAGYSRNRTPSCGFSPQERLIFPTIFRQAKVLQWLSFESDYIQSSVAALRHWAMTGKAVRRPEALVDAKRQASLKALGILDQEVSERAWLAGKSYTIADISAFAYVHRADEAELPLSNYRHGAWIERVQSQPNCLAEQFSYAIDPFSGNELGRGFATTSCWRRAICGGLGNLAGLIAPVKPEIVRRNRKSGKSPYENTRRYRRRRW